MNKRMDSVTRGPLRRGEARRVAPASVILSREATRLLAALANPGAEARPDPFDGEALIVRRAEGGVSLGGGRRRSCARPTSRRRWRAGAWW